MSTSVPRRMSPENPESKLRAGELRNLDLAVFMALGPNCSEQLKPDKIIHEWEGM
jgi:hypothetical protein